jgi:MFS family permease
VNIANADVFGLSEELGLEKTEYNTALVVFFVPYILFEIPSNILLKRFKPHVWLSLNMFLFGLTTLLQGLVQNYSGLIATRFFLGLFETGMFPGGKSSRPLATPRIDTYTYTQPSTSSACGTADTRPSAATPSSSTAPPSPARSAVFSPPPSAR